MNPVSIIIVSWNARSYLRECLASIRQTSAAMVGQIIVVDNASNDGSPEMVAQEFPEATVVRCRQNLGFAQGNNIGLKHASGDYLALVNSDVIVHPGCFEALATFLEKHCEVGLVGPKLFGSDDRLQRTCRRFPSVWNIFCRCLALDSLFPQWRLCSGREMRHWEQDTQREVEVLSGCFWMARRLAVEQVGGLDERFFFYAEDVDWCKRFWNQGWKVVFVPQATATHFDGGSSGNSPLRYSIEILRANLAYWRKHHGVAGQASFFLLSLIHHTLRMVAFGCKRVIQGNRDDETIRKWDRSAVSFWWLVTGRNCAHERRQPPKPAARTA